MRPLRCTGVVAAFVAFGLSDPPAVADSSALSVEPPGAKIGFSYNGVELEVSGELDGNVQFAVLLTGPTSDLNLRKIERVWGLFWAPTENVLFENIPIPYLLRTSAELTKLAPEKLLHELGLGYESFRPRNPGSMEHDSFLELVRLKESEGLFSCSIDATPMSRRAAGDRHPFSVKFPIPAKAPAATYRIRQFVFRDSLLVRKAERRFELRQTKLIAFVTSLAQDHGLLYGLFAVAAALAAGLGVGILYGSARKR